MEREDAGMTFRRGACGKLYGEDFDVDEYRDEPEEEDEENDD